MINPENISFLKKRNNSLVVNVGGRDHTVTVKAGALLKQLVNSGVETSNDQFFRI